MNTPHHPQPVPAPQEEETAAPNTTQLPIEPEFGQMPPPVEPEDPGVKPPQL